MNFVVIINAVAHHAISLSILALLLAGLVVALAGWKQGLPIFLTALVLIWVAVLVQKTPLYYAAGAHQCSQNLQAIAQAKQRWAANPALPLGCGSALRVVGTLAMIGILACAVLTAWRVLAK